MDKINQDAEKKLRQQRKQEKDIIRNGGKVERPARQTSVGAPGKKRPTSNYNRPKLPSKPKAPFVSTVRRDTSKTKRESSFNKSSVSKTVGRVTSATSRRSRPNSNYRRDQETPQSFNEEAQNINLSNTSEQVALNQNEDHFNNSKIKEPEVPTPKVEHLGYQLP